MRFNAGHALNYFNVQPVAALPEIRELHIGHAIVSRALFVGLRDAVAQMKRLIREGAEEGRGHRVGGAIGPAGRQAAGQASGPASERASGPAAGVQG
jgi:hypothetical protein